MNTEEKKERERIVKGMKKNAGSFRKRYGDRAKEVMYATATKLAQESTNTNTPITKKEYRISATISDPQHTMVSKRKEKEYRLIKVNSNHPEKALNAAKKHLLDRGYKIHDIWNNMQEETGRYGENPDNPSFEVRKHYAQHYMKHAKNKSPKEAENWAYGAVHKKYGHTELLKLQHYHKKNMQEEAPMNEETLNELSKWKLKAYLRKANKSAEKATVDDLIYSHPDHYDKEKVKSAHKTFQKRAKGDNRARWRLQGKRFMHTNSGEPKFSDYTHKKKMSEETLNELSKKTLKSYMKKAERSVDKMHNARDKITDKIDRTDDRKKIKDLDKQDTKLHNKIHDREHRLGGAADRVSGIFVHRKGGKKKGHWVNSKYTAEEAMNLQELSKKTLMSYMQKSENEYYKTDDKKKKNKRLRGIVTAGLAHRKKLTKEEADKRDRRNIKKNIGIINKLAKESVQKIMESINSNKEIQ